jgi:hypothetical protein
MSLVSACAELAPTAPCAVSELSQEFAVTRIDRLDVLFVIDNSPAMEPHRPLLDQELPQMITALVSGDFDPTDAYVPTPVNDLHIGFVSTDLGDGIADGDREGCSTQGDQGALHMGKACSLQDAPFVWHFGGHHDAAASISTAMCNSALDSGCNVTQPLEAALTALSHDGFLRSTPQLGLSMILVVFIAAQDDCSLARAPDARPSPFECASNPALTHALERYIDRLQALRSGNETLIRTLVIAGIPQDLLETAEGQPRDPAWDYPTTEQLLADPRMQVRVDEESLALAPACTRGEASAAPARRLVELSRRLNSRQPRPLHSICAEGWTDALYNVVGDSFAWLTRSAPCLPREVARDAEGLTSCRVYWTLPEWFDPQQPLTPSRCEDRPFLRAVEQDESGRMVCELRQLSVVHDVAGFHVGSGDGFYIDDGSDDARMFCPARIPLLAFTEGARPPHGVTVRVACSNAEPRYREPESDPGAPAIGDACQTRRFRPDSPLVESATRCENSADPLLFCDAWAGVCRRGCAADAECPRGWLCDPDARPSGHTLGTCFNPSCEALTTAAADP